MATANTEDTLDERAMVPEHLRIHPGQQRLTPAQEAEMRRFAQERIAAYLSTEVVNEHEAEEWLRAAYHVAKPTSLEPPKRTIWLDSPLGLILLRASGDASVGASVWDSVGASVRASVWDSVGASVRDSVGDSVRASVWDSVRASVWASVWDSVGAYLWADDFSFYRYFDVYHAANDLYALARFNEMVSGYWLGAETALVVRKPRLLARDDRGRLHSATGHCIEYRDGWGFYAWHGVRLSDPLGEHIILAPETLTRDDFLNERNVEVRRVIQERMGERFVPELGGVVIDDDPRRGTLYEVRLPDDDPERVARYVQVKDASTDREYYLRVPPTIATAQAAVAWTFELTALAYLPQQEA